MVCRRRIRQISFKYGVAAVAAFILLTFGGAVTFAPHPTRAQTVDAPAPHAPAPPKERYLVNHFPEGPSLPPKWSIPIDPLGFSAPGALYLGSRNALVSLDFIDEDRLLFTFRIPGLLHRDSTNSEEGDERRIRAVLLALPQGTVTAETTWTVHDRLRYLWMLHNGHFLVRDRNNLFESDASLALKPYLDFPGSLVWLELDPTEEFLVTNSREPVSTTAKPGQVASPATAAASVTSEQDPSALDNAVPEMVVRILDRKSGQVMLVSRTRTSVHLPINSLGYIENLRGQESKWMLNLNYFTGGTKLLGSVDSACEPDDDFISDREILVTGCGPSGESKLEAVTTDGRTLWISEAPATQVWPHLTVAANSSRIAWATLDMSHAVNSYAPMAAEDVKEQSVTIFDTADGDIPLVAPLNPIFDAGGNVAISPSGQRVALINNGAIQVFELPAPVLAPAAPGTHSAR